MATYDYRCPKCGVFEVEQSIKDNPLEKCPKCHGKVKRLISSSGIVFKGSGFYVTDHRTDKHSTGASSKSESKPKEPAKTESKPKETKKTETKK